MRGSPSVKLAWSLTRGPGSGIAGALPPSLLSRFFFLFPGFHLGIVVGLLLCIALCSTLLQLSFDFRNFSSRVSCRCNSAGMLISCWPWPFSDSARLISSATSARSCASSLQAYAQLMALCLLALALILVPSILMGKFKQTTAKSHRILIS